MSTARDRILGRVKQALRTPAPEPHWLHEETGTGPVFPLPTDDLAALRERFRLEFVAIHGELVQADSLGAARELLLEWIAKEEIKRLLVVDTPLFQQLLSGHSQVQWLRPDETDRIGWEDVDVGVTPCESLVAESGTIVVSAGLSGRAPSVLPPIHLVIATEDQLVADMDSAIARLRAKYPQLPSTMSFISGPSRTADIEKILVLGAHGPRRLRLLLIPAIP